MGWYKLLKKQASKIINKAVGFICFFIAIFMVSGIVKAQQNVSFNHLLVQHGLSQSTIYSILQDSDGFIWIATRDGLNRYDGYEFKVFRNDESDTTSISDNQVFVMAEDNEGMLYIGTNNGLSMYNKNTDAFSRFYNKPNQKASLSNNHVYALLVHSSGNVWVGTDGGGISIYNKKTASFTNLFHGSQKYKESQIRSILELPDKSVWIGTKGNGVLIYKEGKIEQVTTENNNFCGILSNSIRLIYSDSQNNIWIGSDEHGVTCYNLINKNISHYTTNSETKLSHNAVRAILEDKLGNVWIGTRIGLNHLNHKTGEITHILNDELNEKSLSNNSIRSIAQDNSGNLWFGTYYGGINVIYGSSNNFTLYKPSRLKQNGLSYQIVSSFAQDSKGNIWVGTEGGGINKLKKGTTLFKTIKSNGSKNSLVNDNVKELYIDDDDIMYIGTYGGGLDVYNIRNQTFKNYQNNANNRSSISSNYIYSVLKDSKSRIWVGANMGGINIFSPDEGNFEHVTLTFNGYSLKGETINDIIEDAVGNIWFATDVGLLKFDNKAYRWISLLGKNQTLNTLSLTIDMFGTIWAGTEGNGIFAIAKNCKIKQYKSKDGINGSVIFGIKSDSKNNLWISSNNGLLKFPLNKHYKLPYKTDTLIINYDVNDGLQGNEFNRGASFVSNDSLFYFGGLNGFNVFDPVNIAHNTTIPPVAITGFYVSNKKVTYYGSSSPLKKHISRTNKIVLNHKQSSFSFEFVALNFDKPQKNQYAYKLEGFDPEESGWIYSGKNHVVSYTNIYPGDYIFKVKASNNDNIWNHEGKQIAITVLPPFWRTKLAFVIYLILLAMLLYAFRRMVVFRTNQKNLLENERLEKQRIEELNQMKLRFFTNISHEFRTPLTLISGPLEKLMKVPDMQAVEKNYLYALMHKNMSRLHRLINQLMDFRKLENKKMRLSVSEDNLYHFLNEVVQGFSEFCKQKDIELNITVGDAEISKCWFDPSILDNIIFILLSNAIKFTQTSGKITVEINVENGMAEIKVCDTGIGISEEKLNRIFERFYTDNSLKYTKSMGTGIGLSFAQSLVELHKGKISVESEVNKGTTFSICIPVNRNAYVSEEINTKTKVDSLGYHVVTPDVIPKEQVKLNTDADAAESILIVEDNLELREFIKSNFGNYTLYEAENGKEAFKLAKKHLPDIIISDVMMPVMDGMEFCKMIKNNQITSHIPVILLTAKANIEHKIEGTNYGADVYMEKPFNIELLSANVCNLLLQRKALRERFSGHILNDKPNEEFEKIEDKFIKNVQDIIFKKKSDPDLSVEYLGEKLGLSRSQLFRKFKALTDHSPNEFIKVVRLKYATELMAKGELNVNQIAYECGFSNPSHFIASFKKYYNKTPKEYAKLVGMKN